MVRHGMATGTDISVSVEAQVIYLCPWEVKSLSLLLLTFSSILCVAQQMQSNTTTADE